MYRDYFARTMKTGALLAPLLLAFAASAQNQNSATESAAKPESPSSSASATSPWVTSNAAVPSAAVPTAEAEPPRAQTPAPGDSAPQPQIHLAMQAPAPPPVVKRTDKTHDGFYVRISFGFGSQSTTLDDGTPYPNYDSTAGALVFNGLVGGAPAPGVIIGGSLALDSLPSTTFSTDGYEAKTGLNLVSVGPFIDGYPDSRGGFHLGGTVGPSIAKLTTNPGFGTKSAGVGLAAWLGYDWWVADQWSVGGLLRFSGANTWSSGSAPKPGIDVRSISLLLTAVYQ